MDDLWQLIGRDPVRPWPGVPRDPDVVAAGMAELSAGNRTATLCPGGSGSGEALPDVLFVPLGHLSRAARGSDDLLAAAIVELRTLVRPGGLVVTEELVAPSEAIFDVVEPIDLAPDRAVIVSVCADGAGWRVAATEFVDGAQTTSTDALALHTATWVDATFATIGFEVVGRWADWSGTDAATSPWHVAVHRAATNPFGVEAVDNR